VKFEPIFYAEIIRQIGVVATLWTGAKKHTWKKEGLEILVLPADHLPNGEKLRSKQITLRRRRRGGVTPVKFHVCSIAIASTSPPLVLL
jgi:hypothetical protein